jgi:hypothetical protein
MKKDADDDDDLKVVLTQTLCKMEQVFVYKIPPMKISSGHRAEDWDLAKPAATCSLALVQRDNTLLIQLLGHRPKQVTGKEETSLSASDHAPPTVMEDFLFAQATIVSDPTCDKALRPIEYWVEAVVDSSRYFVIRCEDEKSNRQAHVGIGFRERDESLNFKMGMEDFWRSMERERKSLHMTPGSSDTTGSESSSENESSSSLTGLVSNLSLKEGEKIHVNVKQGGHARQDRNHDAGKPSAMGKGGLLLKKPPPPVGSCAPPTPPSNSKDKVVINADATQKEQTPAMPLPTDDTATAATEVEDAEDDDWGDFEG